VASSVHVDHVKRDLAAQDGIGNGARVEGSRR